MVCSLDSVLLSEAALLEDEVLSALLSDSLLLSLSAVLWEELLLVLSDLLLSEEDTDVLPEEVEELPELELEAGSGLTVMVSALLTTAQSLYTTTA